MKKYLALIIVLPFLVSCAAALIGGGFYKSSKTKEQRQEFTSQFQKTNMDREEKGLKPLDWCTEAYKFDEGYANNDKQCDKRIKAYKNGDMTALDMGTTPVNTIDQNQSGPSGKANKIKK